MDPEKNRTGEYVYNRLISLNSNHFGNHRSLNNTLVYHGTQSDGDVQDGGALCRECSSSGSLKLFGI